MHTELPHDILNVVSLPVLSEPLEDHSGVIGVRGRDTISPRDWLVAHIRYLHRQNRTRMASNVPAPSLLASLSPVGFYQWLTPTAHHCSPGSVSH